LFHIRTNAEQLHKKYNERATSENWIEQVKNHLLAGKTLTNDFHVNDLLWQISVFAYNISVMMRIKIKKILERRAQYIQAMVY